MRSCRRVTGRVCERFSVANSLATGPVDSLIGQGILINGNSFIVSGILDSKGFSGQQDLDDRAIAVGTAVQDALYGYAPPGGGGYDRDLIAFLRDLAAYYFAPIGEDRNGMALNMLSALARSDLDGTCAASQAGAITHSTIQCHQQYR